MATPIVKLEFDVQLNSKACCEAVKKSLSETGIEDMTFDLPGQSVIVQTSLPSSIIVQKIEETGRMAILKGLGPASYTERTDPGQRLTAAAVCALSGPNNIVGVVRFLQVDDQTCVIDGTVDGLKPDHEHGLHVYEYGDISNGCTSLGNHYNPTNSTHGGPKDANKHAGDLGNVSTDVNGRATFRMEIDRCSIKVHDLIGRSMAISADRDDLGLGNSEQSKLNGNSGEGIACGIIARSAGIFENPKRICACSGKTVWDEREDALNRVAAKKGTEN